MAAPTVRLAVEGDPNPLSVDEIRPVVLTFVPAVFPVTFTTKVQDALAASRNPERLMLPLPATAVGVPAVSTDPLRVRQVPLWPLGVATTSPAGKISGKPIDCKLVDEFGFVIVKVRLVVAPIAMEPVPNACVRVGGCTAFTWIVFEVPVRLFGVSVAVMV